MPVERLILAVLLTGGLWSLLAPAEDSGRARRFSALLLLGALSWVLLAWPENTRFFPDTFPDELHPLKAVVLQFAGLVLGAAAFAAAGGRGRARLGAAFGLTMSAIGWCASRWPLLSRAIELNGGTFAGPFLSWVLPVAFAATAAFVAAVLLIKDARAHSLKLVIVAAVLWAVPTMATEAALSRWWGLGPRTLAQAAGIPTNDDAETVSIVRLTSSRGRAVARETARMAAQNVDLSPESLTKLEQFLRRVEFRDVFALEAVDDVRRGWLLWWEPERALDAMMMSAPGRVSPDFRGALDLIKVGPLTAERYDKLEQLSALAAEGGGAFRQVTSSQYIFEGFAAAYARFNDEPKARKWLGRVDNLMMVSEKKVEIAPLEDFRLGRVTGSLSVDGRPAGAVVVGLFQIWRTTTTSPGTRLLSSASFPDENGAFAFENLGPGEYELGLLGRAADLRGQILGSPGRFELGYDHPVQTLPPIRVERDVLPVPEAFGPARLPEAQVPEVPEPPLLWRKR